MSNENQLRELLERINEIYMDTLSQKIHQKNKIQNYKEGVAKINDAKKLLKQMREEINAVESHDKLRSNADDIKDFVNALQFEGFRLNEIITGIDILKKMSNEGLQAPTIQDCNVEKNVFTENDVYGS